MWICERCRNELGDYNGFCVFCFEADGIKSWNPDKYYIREVCIYAVTHGIAERSEAKMTPQEELFKELFTGAVKIVAGMDALTRRAYREEMQKIAYEARVHVAAVDKIDDDEKKEKRRSQPFERSLNTDQSTTDAINTIKERQKRLTKQEKIQQGLEDMFKKSGMSLSEAQREAQRLMGAGTILAVTNPEKAKIVETAVNDVKQSEVVKPNSETSHKMFNPFAK
jgi:hypothetical protein